jgi:flavorubredoxin
LKQEVNAMKKILVAYFSLSGITEMMAQYISEGVRFSGLEAVMKKISDIKSAEDLIGFDGYLLGSPTYHREMAGPMKTFLFLFRKVETAGKPAGAFGSYTHDGNAPKDILDTLEYVFKMKPFKLNSLNMLESIVITSEGMRACQDYGKVFGQEIIS